MSEPSERDPEMVASYLGAFLDYTLRASPNSAVATNARDAALMLVKAARAEGNQAGYERGRREAAGLFDAIAHGDEAHRAWLKQAIEDHFAGRPVQKPAGEGGYERGRREAIEECAEKASWAIHDASLLKGDAVGNYQARVILAQAAVGAIRALAEPPAQQASQE